MKLYMGTALSSIGTYIFVFNKQLVINTFKYHVFAPMGRFQLESIYERPTGQKNTKGKLILSN